MAVKKLTYVWQDRKRTLFGLPLSFTRYMLTENRLFVEKGFLNSVLDEENLYRVRDVRVSRSLGQKLFGLGTVTVFSSDTSSGQTKLESIKHPLEVKEELVRLVEQARRKNRIRASEMMVDGRDCDQDDADEDFDADRP